MITLYTKPGCPYCERTLKVVRELQVPIQEKSSATPGVVEELIAIGGKRQFPYMVDSERGAAMYESEDIMAYLHEKFSAPA